MGHKVVFIAEALAAMQTETRKRHPSGIFPEDNAAKTRNPIGRSMNQEAVQMFATPAECILKDFVEFGDTGCADHQQSPPHQRTHAAEHYAKLINRNGRYRRFRHANSLSKRKPTVLNLMTPRNLPLSRGTGFVQFSESMPAVLCVGFYPTRGRDRACPTEAYARPVLRFSFRRKRRRPLQFPPPYPSAARVARSWVFGLDVGGDRDEQVPTAQLAGSKPRTEEVFA